MYVCVFLTFVLISCFHSPTFPTCFRQFSYYVEYTYVSLGVCILKHTNTFTHPHVPSLQRSWRWLQKGISKFSPVKVPWEKAMAPHSSTLARKIPWMEEPGRLQSMGSQRVGQDWATSLSLVTFMHQRRKRQPTPVLLPGESQAQGSLVGCHLWGRIESDTTEAT